jgi:hypothetical protein
MNWIIYYCIINRSGHLGKEIGAELKWILGEVVVTTQEFIPHGHCFLDPLG